MDNSKTKQTCCSICTQTFNEPNILPCGENICEKCLDEQLKTSKYSLKCQFCNKRHKVPQNGFPKLIKQEDITEVLVKFESNIIDLSSSLDNAQQKVQAHCEYIKDEIEISFESVIDELNKLKQKMVHDIDEYQDKCVKNIEDDSKTERKMFQELLVNCQQKLSDWKNTEEDALKITKESLELTNSLKNARNDFEKFYFDDQVMTYKERKIELDPSTLGRLVYKNYETNNDQFLVDIDRLKLLQASKKINYSVEDVEGTLNVHRTITVPTSDNRFLICTYEVRCAMFTVALRLVDGKGQFLKKNLDNTNCHLISVSAYDKFTCVILRDNFGAHSMKLYDTSNLRLIKELKLSYLPISCAIDTENEQIHVLSFQNPFFLMYTMDLEAIVGRIQNDDHAVYMPVISSMIYRKGKLFIKNDHDSKLRVISLELGRLEYSVDLPKSSDCFIDVDFGHKVFAVNWRDKKLKVYDFFSGDNDDDDDKLVYERILVDENVAQNSSICISDNGLVVLNNPALRFFYFY
jgi:hypothetical protein